MCMYIYHSAGKRDRGRKNPPPPPLRSRGGEGRGGGEAPDPVEWFEGPCSKFLKHPKAFAHL